MYASARATRIGEYFRFWGEKSEIYVESTTLVNEGKGVSSLLDQKIATTLYYEIDVKFKKRQDLMEFFFSKISRPSTRERREREREREHDGISRFPN